MIKLDEDALICDLAETYQIYDYRQLPLLRVAVFSCGLSEDSRIKMRMSNQIIPMETLLLAGLSDKISVLLWTKTKDGQKGRNRPPMILDAFNQSKTKQRETVVFNSGEDFEERRKELLKQATSGGGD
ncbi:DUF5361 domain-containing protein [Enterococcus raffinosus]|uniref:DUF5361 domain-containing protein n=1 Tax=Enterococcus TaxID=1350 RepID=UPI0007F5171A|nr:MULTISPECIES: DUF5361 domain-containing protein [Enterococcus]SAM60840.1 hypothetical protein DTPHA_1401544 [Enterococcus faecium]MZJ56164.1 hypothetical protein [Enterococcus avium]MZJ76747.1 hypothetical protein [Enterococcus avium]MZJ80944.1 hypothetical protein [Enterococcus avium]MZJ87205.1 hypothetical protein [Enterococcus avium]